MFLVCFGLIGFGLYLQHAQGVEACYCILQLTFITIGVIALVAALHNREQPAVGLQHATGDFRRSRRSVATRHVWLEQPAQGLRLRRRPVHAESFPLADVLPMIFRGTPTAPRCCGVSSASIAEWALIWFAIFLVAAIVAAAMKQKRLKCSGPEVRQPQPARSHLRESFRINPLRSALDNSRARIPVRSGCAIRHGGAAPWRPRGRTSNRAWRPAPAESRRGSPRG